MLTLTGLRARQSADDIAEYLGVRFGEPSDEMRVAVDLYVAALFEKHASLTADPVEQWHGVAKDLRLALAIAVTEREHC